MKSFLGAPIQHRGRHVGNLYLSDKQGGEECTQEDVDTLTMFASQVAMAITIPAPAGDGAVRPHPTLVVLPCADGGEFPPRRLCGRQCGKGLPPYRQPAGIGAQPLTLYSRLTLTTDSGRPMSTMYAVPGKYHDRSVPAFTMTTV